MRLAINKCCNKLWCPGLQTVLNMCSLVAPRGPWQDLRCWAEERKSKKLLQSKKLPLFWIIKDGIGKKIQIPEQGDSKHTSISRKHIREGHTAGGPSAASMTCPVCAATWAESRQGTEQNQRLRLRHWIAVTKETATCKATRMRDCSQTGDSNITILKARLHPSS